MIDVPTLTDGLVILRKHSEDDLAGIVEQSNDPLSIAWTTVPQPYALGDAKRFVREIMPGGWATDEEWGFAVDVDGRFGGTVSLHARGEGRAEVAFGAHPSIRGTGAMEQALRLLLAWGFDERGLEVVTWSAYPGNWGSRRLVESVGFAFEGTRRLHLAQRGRRRDAWVGSLVRDDPREFRTRWLEVPVLEADGLRLRPMSDADVPRIVEACSDERTQHWLGRLPSPYTADSARAYLESQRENLATGSGVTWAVTEPSVTGDSLLAAISLFDHTPEVEVEIGYWAHPEARGRGVVTRAVPSVTTYAFDGLGVARVKVLAAVDNTASRRVIEANGFTHTGIERLGTQILGGYADLALYDVLREEWTR